jgi:sulfonate transport system substrate-binding protein
MLVGTTLFVVAIIVGLGACNSSGSDGSSAGAADGKTLATVPTRIPPGTSLRVGDQLDYLKLVLSLSGQDKGVPYSIDYSSFVGGPPMLQAFQAGAIDTGFVGSTPLIFAQAAGQPISAIAGWASNGGQYALLTAPGVKGVRSWKDVKGKRVVFQQGTAGEAVVLEGLDSAGLSLSDITPVNVPITQTSAALQSGSADAGVLVEPLTSAYLAKNPSARQVLKATEITDRSAFLIATKDALDDRAKAAALGDFATRLVRAFAYLRAHPELVTQNVYVKQYGLTAERAAEVQKEIGGSGFVTLPGEVLGAQQRLADLFHDAGEIPSKVDVRSEFDTRYNAIVAAAESK